MRIAIIPSWYPAPESPANGIFIREQAKALARRAEVTVLTPRFPSLADQLSLHWGPELIEEQDQGIDTWRVRRLKIPTLRRWVPFLRGPDHVLVYYRKFAAAIRSGFARYVRERGLPDLLHAHVVFPAGWVAVELGKELGIPVVLTEHSEPFAMHLATATQRALVGEILRGADQVVAVSSILRDTINRVFPDVSIEVVGNVIDTEFFRMPAPTISDNKTVLRFFALGFLTERKGFQFLFQAIRLLLDTGCEDFEVCVGGDGPYRGTLERLASGLGIRSHCRFLGMLDRAMVCAQMQACDVFVLPSLGETFGVVLGEAMACGKPVLSTRCGGPEEVVTPETGVLVTPADPRELADAMAGFLSHRYAFDPGTIRDSVERRYGAATFVERMEILYARTIDAFRNQCARKILGQAS